MKKTWLLVVLAMVLSFLLSSCAGFVAHEGDELTLKRSFTFDCGEGLKSIEPYQTVREKGETVTVIDFIKREGEPDLIEVGFIDNFIICSGWIEFTWENVK